MTAFTVIASLEVAGRLKGARGINAAYAMNTMVHNTAWIQGHFHLTVGTTVGLTFMGATYWLLPRLTGRELRLPALARLQPYLWFAGMVLFSGANHVAGLMGMPRRIYDVTYLGAEQAARWVPLTRIAAAGAVVLFVSALCYVVVSVATWVSGRRGEAPAFEFARPLVPVGRRGLWDRLGLWTAVAVILIAVAYAYPLFQLLSQQRFGSPGVAPF